MKIFCTDGTTVECATFRAMDSGILLFDGDPEDDEHEEAIGFVPITQLRYVLPDETEPAPQQAMARTQQQQHPTSPSTGEQRYGQTGTGSPQQTGGGSQQTRQPSGEYASGSEGGRSGRQYSERTQRQRPPESGRR